jgi:hypothetical protein
METMCKETVADGACINVKHAACPTTRPTMSSGRASFRREGKDVFVESIDVE